MNQITRTSEPAAPRSETPAAPRGEELQQASSRFAELLAKESKDGRGKVERDKAKDDDRGDGAAKFEERADASCGLPYGIYLPGERGQGSRQNPSQQEVEQEMMNGDSSNVAACSARPPSLETPAFDVDAFLGRRTTTPDADQPTTSVAPPTSLGGEPRVATWANATESEPLENATPLPTPGDLLLQAFSKPPVEAVEPPARLGPPVAVDSIRELGEQIAERILISQAESAGATEMMIQLKDAVLPGTEVRMVHDGERLRVTLLTDNASSFHLLASQQADLQARLGEKVVVTLSFDPEGMISRQRLDAPLAAEGAQQPGDDRRRDADDQRRDRRREQQQQDHGA